MDNSMPDFQEIFTEEEVRDFGEVLATTDGHCIFVMCNEGGKDTVHLFTPLAKCRNSDKFYYQKVDFK